MKKLADGFNSDRKAFSGCEYGCHSEMDAIRRLKKIRVKNKLVPVDFYVTRVNRSGMRRSSKPCSKCIKHMHVTMNKKGYVVKNVFYPIVSDDLTIHAPVICIKFTDLENDNDKFVSTGFIRNDKRMSKSKSSGDSSSS